MAGRADGLGDGVGGTRPAWQLREPAIIGR